MCEDATNCYDRGADPYASLCYQSCGMGICYLELLFKIFQSMKMHLRTAFGALTSFYTVNEQPFQGTVQGNFPTLALWLIMSVLLIRNLYQKRYLLRSLHLFRN